MQQLQPNITLQGGKYRIERVLGQGGFGITYLATQTSLQRKVAIKEFFMKDFCSRDSHTMYMQSFTAESAKQVEQYRKKFFKEAGNLSRLHHPNIISVIDVFEENGTVYYSMPYYSGGSLQEYVDAHGALSESEAMKLTKQPKLLRLQKRKESKPSTRSYERRTVWRPKRKSSGAKEPICSVSRQHTLRAFSRL